MKVRVRIKISDEFRKKLESIEEWFHNFRSKYPLRFLFSVIIIPSLVLTPIIKFTILDRILIDGTGRDVNVYANDVKSEGIERELKLSGSSVLGTSVDSFRDEVTTDVGFVDLRVLTLEDFFRHFKSPLADYSDEFIEACERYGVNNWQLLPAIAMAETLGCQTGESFRQRNCWGWGGSGSNRVEFDSFKQAIDTITYRMIAGYGNDRMNARDIQSTYCGISCMQWGWRWAIGVNNYTIRINDFGQSYGLPRTNEVENFNS
jgi:hypothetical protein